MFEKRRQAKVLDTINKHRIEVLDTMNKRRTEWVRTNNLYQRMYSMTLSDTMTPFQTPGGVVEMKTARGHYTGKSQGVSIPITDGIRYRTGAMKGHYVPGPESFTVIDNGNITIDGRGATFVGSRITRQWLWAKSLTLMNYKDFTMIPVTNRQKTSGISYSDPLTQFALNVAYHYYHGTIASLRASTLQMLADHRHNEPREGA